MTDLTSGIIAQPFVLAGILASILNSLGVISDVRLLQTWSYDAEADTVNSPFSITGTLTLKSVAVMCMSLVQKVDSRILAVIESYKRCSIVRSYGKAGPAIWPELFSTVAWAR